MKYTLEKTIDVPRDKMIELLDNADNMKHWQEGLQSYKHLEGEPGKEGAKMELHYKMGKREVEMVETIIKSNFPEAFDAVYEAKGVWNKQANRFEAIGSNQTKWISESEFKFSNPMLKLMAFLMPGMFKKQSEKYLIDFKAFAEKAAAQN